MNYKISASILTGDFLRLAEEIDSIIDHVDELHLDVCDGHFVPSLSFGEAVSAQLGTHYAKRCHIDAHLMVSNPQERIPPFLESGAQSVIFHIEAAMYPHTLIADLQSADIVAGIGVIPRTPAAAIIPLAEFCQRILVMTVNPGFGGQALIPQMLKKVAAIRLIVGDKVDIIVDGGINLNTIRDAKNAGANIFVVGSALLNAPKRIEYIQQLRAVL